MRDELPPAFAGRPRPLALVATVLAWLVVTVALSSLLAPFAFDLVEAVAPGSYPFPRVFRRVAMLVAIAALWALRRPLGLGSLARIGMALSRGRLRAFGAAALVGALAIGAAGGLELALGTRVPAGTLTAGEAAETIVGATAIGVVEEGLLRGAFLFPFGRLAGAGFWGANATVSALYSTVHFARGARDPGAIDAGAGWRLWAAVPAAARRSGEAWIGLFATGALFYVLAWRQGHAWGAAGLHAGAVLALQFVGQTSDPGANGRSLLLVDGLLPGYGVAVLAAVASVWLARQGPATEDAAPED